MPTDHLLPPCARPPSRAGSPEAQTTVPSVVMAGPDAHRAGLAPPDALVGAPLLQLVDVGVVRPDEDVGVVDGQRRVPPHRLPAPGVGGPVQVELPDFLAVVRAEALHEAPSGAEDDVALAGQQGVGGGPAAAQDLVHPAQLAVRGDGVEAAVLGAEVDRPVGGDHRPAEDGVAGVELPQQLGRRGAVDGAAGGLLGVALVLRPGGLRLGPGGAGREEAGPARRQPARRQPEQGRAGAKRDAGHGTRSTSSNE